MNHILHEPTAIAEWRNLLIEGQQKTGFLLTESVESYVVLTLDANTTNIDLSSVVIAIDFLKNIHTHSMKNVRMLRRIGDQCLILAGLFPDRAKRRNVSQDYFKNLGENAYYVLSYSALQWKLDRALFYQLFENFSALVEVLHAMRTRNEIYKLQG
jgi:hypothetical protein